MLSAADSKMANSGSMLRNECMKYSDYRRAHQLWNIQFKPGVMITLFACSAGVTWRKNSEFSLYESVRHTRDFDVCLSGSICNVPFCMYCRCDATVKLRILTPRMSEEAAMGVMRFLCLFVSHRITIPCDRHQVDVVVVFRQLLLHPLWKVQLRNWWLCTKGSWDVYIRLLL